MISHVVLEIGEIHLEGNITPHAWYRTPLLRHPSGKANKVAIDILADLVYWYRPIVVRDDLTNLVLEVRQKFKGDRFQIYYQRWADFFGYTHRQVKDGVAFLKQNGLITVELRTIEINGMRWGNVPFLEPVAARIREISRPAALLQESENGSTPSHVATSEGGPHVVTSEGGSHIVTSKGARSNVRAHTLERAHTEITTETSTETNNHTHTAVEPPTAKLRRCADRAARGVCVRSAYSLEEWLHYAEHLQQTGKRIDNPEGLALKLYETGKGDALMKRFLIAPTPAASTSDVVAADPGCRLCYGTGMEVVPGKGARRCQCRQRQSVATGGTQAVPPGNSQS